MNVLIASANELKNTFEELSVKSDAVASGYNQNKEVIFKAIQEAEISYHLNAVNLGCLHVLADDWDLERGEYNRLLTALANFDEALKKQYAKEKGTKKRGRIYFFDENNCVPFYF